LGVSREDAADLEEWLTQITGMCLATGPAGSGKTTTLYALLHELELSDNAVITIEDPVEYAIDGITQIQVNYAHGLTFAEGLKAMLRLDPDFLLVGEMRDEVSARTAVEAAASGHVMMSTLHSPDAMGVVTLLRNWGVADHQIATVLQIVISQRLVRRLCLNCRTQDAPTPLEQAWLTSLNLPAPQKSWHPRGCPACSQTGYAGRIGVFEIWRKTESDYRLLLEHTDEHSLRRHLRERGRKTVLEDGLVKAREGVTSLAELQHMGALTTFHDQRLSRKKSTPPSEPNANQQA
jgi:type II secretory ATPase GspE/PulE/Tfp pilus assembly ATPase PilB-like protein